MFKTIFIALCASLLVGECWSAPEGRIVGGEAAALGQFPHQVLIKYQTKFICGGSIISKDHVLTAAHCVKNGVIKPEPATDFVVFAGSILSSGEAAQSVAEKVIPHEEYIEGKFINDIAVIKLSTPLVFTDNINDIQLRKVFVPLGSEVIISGFGYTAEGGPVSTVLRYNILTATFQEDCAKASGINDPGILCLAHAKSNGFCTGDSGGPAIYKDELVGVANYIVNACGTSYPDGYAKVSHYVTWIQEKMKL